MIIARTLYPPTDRIQRDHQFILTEKLDGSNLGFFVSKGELYIAQRNNIYKLTDIDKPEIQEISYKGLINWLKEHGEDLERNMHEASCIFGEWIGTGHIKYGGSLDKKFYMFAKANIDLEDDFLVYNLFWDRSLLNYPFKDQAIPEFMDLVPVVAHLGNYPSVSELDLIYQDYREEVKRPVEGFVIYADGNIKKYVRHKRGTLTDHHD